MNKVVEFLEKYVEWVALALGGLFVGYTVYTYALQTPVTVADIAPKPQTLTPGEVDNYISGGVAETLEKMMKDPAVPVMTVPHFVDAFKTKINEGDFKPVELTVNWGGQTVAPPIFNNDTKGPGQQQTPVTALAVIPPASVLETSSGKSNLIIAPSTTGADRAWVTVRYSISPKQISDAFEKAHVPAWTGRTLVLRAELWRQEDMGTGQWSPKSIVAPLNAALLAPYPAEGDGGAQADYLKWAPDHTVDLLQPPFAQVAAGNPWMLPGQSMAPVPVAAPVPLDPTKEIPFKILSQYSVAERQAYAKARAALKQQQQQGNRRPNNSGGGAGGPPSGRTDNSILDVDRARSDPLPNFAPAMPSSEQPDSQDIPGSGSVPSPGMSAAASPGSEQMAGAVAAAATSLPHGDFDPKQMAGDIIGWAHDVTVVPGHTYRYTIDFKIKNPIYHTNAAKDKALTDQFDLVSGDASWTSPISISTSTNFFVASNSRNGAPSARFKVFKWENGAEKMREFEVAPGDQIGDKFGQTDFATGSTLVALRFDDPKNLGSMFVMVMDGNGRISERSYSEDLSKPELKTLTEQVGQAPAASAAPAP